MKKILFSSALITLLMSFSIQNKVQLSLNDCDGCEYSIEFKKNINNGDDTVYDLRCSDSGRHYDILQRTNGKWERFGTDKQYSKCDLIAYMCDCD